jgi:ATP-dependent exoDNAse (exonuclease V) alpha subunit
MRLEALKLFIETTYSSPEQQDTTQYTDAISDLKLQTNYGEVIVSIGEGYDHINCCIANENKEECTQIRHICDNTITTIIADQSINNGLIQPEILQFMYPDGYNFESIKNVAILATTNAKVDEWNRKVQSMNTNPTHDLISKDSLSEVDDPYSFLANMLSDNILNEVNDSTSPPHLLSLKVGDICLVMRNLSMKNGLQTNSRVIITKICPQKKTIHVQTIEDEPKHAIICRIRFNIKLPMYESFEITRIQFPLKLAYAITINKSQGQTLSKVLLDVRDAPFAHGHLYVALSRITLYKNIKIYCAADDINLHGVLINNVVYAKIIETA